MPEGEGSGALTAGDLAVRGTLMAAIITVPSLGAFFASWAILDDLIQAAIIGGVIHFVAMGFSINVSKKLLVKRPRAGPDV